jgi:hypothetical protein
MPPTWRGPEWRPYTYVFTETRPIADAVRRFFAAAARSELSNPRLLWPEVFALSSLFHPLFFAAVANEKSLDPDIWGGAHARRALARGSGVATVRFWLQSTLFLAGVTLSAAVVQSRWSSGTIASKLDRLWQAAQCATPAGLHSLAALRLADFVGERARVAPNVDLLIDLKRAFGRALAAVTDDVKLPQVTLTEESLGSEARARFGFLDMLTKTLDGNLRCVIAYGSSVTSARFADYDAIVVVDDARDALLRLAGRHLAYAGVELNLSVFDVADFQIFQRISGDNLTDHARCLWGEIAVPVKPVDDLLLRNYSFGFVRLRQLIGMAAHAARRPLGEGRDEKRSLYGYFAKIPLNVMKGISAAVGEPVAKESIAGWMRDELAYDVDEQLRRCARGHGGAAIATAAWATAEVMARMNEAHPVYRRVPASDAQLWDELESPAARPVTAEAAGA